MAKFRVTSPDGQKFEVTAPDGASQDEVLAYAKANMPKAKPQASLREAATDTAKSFATGVAEGFAPIADALVDVGPMGFLKKAADLTDTFRGKPQAGIRPGVNPFGATVARDGHKPETVAGEYGRTVGQMAPNFFAPASGIAGRVANVVAPGLLSEGAGQTVRAAGGDQRIEAGARIAGAVAGGGLASVRRGPKPAPRPAATPKMAPEQLRPAKEAAYKAADDAGVTYSPQAMDRLVSNIRTDLAKARLNTARHPKAASFVADDLAALEGQSPTLTELDQIRQVVSRDVAGAADKAERFMGKRIIRQIDEFTNSAGPQDVVSGDAQAAADLINRARDLNTRYRKVDAVEGAVKSAVRRAGSTGSGGNSDNAIRQNLRRVLEKGNNLTSQEANALEEIVMGGKGQNLLRQLGKLSPSGNGLMAAGNLFSAAALGPLGAVPGVAGIVAKLSADRMTAGKVAALVHLMAEGGTKAAPIARPAMKPAQIAHTAKNVFASAAPASAGALVFSAAPAMSRERQGR